MSKDTETKGEEESHGKAWVLAEDLDNSLTVSSHSPAPQKLRICETNPRADLNLETSSGSEGRIGGSSGVEPQDADYSYVPQLSDELEAMILARLPQSEYWKLYFLNKQFSFLLKSGEIFKIRKEIGLRESSVFMLACGDSCWWAFDPQFKSCRRLPNLPSDECFSFGDKESLCAGSHMIVSGKEIGGAVVWRYELETNKWRKGPSMINPRCLFGSATCGIYAFVAGGIGMETGGIGMETGGEVLNSAERYNPQTKSWDHLPRMHQRRKLCSGCFMDNKFYVIGGRNEEGKDLTCGEAYDEAKNTWELIPDMLKDTPVATFQSPPLIAVVNNALYSLETSSNELRVYLKSSNTWKKLGPVPVRADFNRGWGVAFKSLGNELLVIGASSASSSGDSMNIYTCCPSSGAQELQWRPLECCERRLSHFILNCSVMVA